MSDGYVPAPTPAEWQEKINLAIDAGSLRWSHQFATTWSLDGECPHCRHPGFSQVYDMKIWRGVLQTDTATFAPTDGATSAPARPVIDIEVACVGAGCGTSHGEAGTPCGAGVGPPITCLVPQEALDSVKGA